MRGVQSFENQFPRLIYLLFSNHLAYASNQATDSKDNGENRKSDLFLILSLILETE